MGRNRNGANNGSIAHLGDLGRGFLEVFLKANFKKVLYLQYVHAHDTLILKKEGSMPNMTLSIPVELKQKMDRFKEINWSEVARQAILEKTLLLGRMNQLMSSSRISEPETLYEGRKISRKVSKKHK
jgi:hypothetical protein